MYSTGIDRFGLEASGLAVAGLTNKELINAEIRSAKMKVNATVVFFMSASQIILSLHNVKRVLVKVSELRAYFFGSNFLTNVFRL
jgi:uncharacterized protein HemY